MKAHKSRLRDFMKSSEAAVFPNLTLSTLSTALGEIGRVRVRLVLGRSPDRPSEFDRRSHVTPGDCWSGKSRGRETARQQGAGNRVGP